MTALPILMDVTERGRVRPWAERKRQSLAVAEAFRTLGGNGLKRHERITHCGAFLEFEALLRPATGERQAPDQVELLQGADVPQLPVAA